ncbi:MAG: glucosamine-6-phosphate isomerase [Spirochaetales bacterium]
MQKYDIDLRQPGLPLPVEVVETDIDLYYRIAFALYHLIETQNRKGSPTAVILPVGPVFQYRRFVWLQRERPLDLRNATFFFMDEYLNETGDWVEEDSPLSFRGFIRRELLTPLQDSSLPKEARLTEEQILFPDPKNLSGFDARYEETGGADICFAGIGITGHLAFNEPPLPGTSLTSEEFCNLPSRIVTLAPETIAINSNTALRGAMDCIPRQAVTIGFRQILKARRIRIYCNRPWQSAVVRRALFDPASPQFPVTLVRKHPDVRLIITAEVAEKPSFGLR